MEFYYQQIVFSKGPHRMLANISNVNIRFRAEKTRLSISLQALSLAFHSELSLQVNHFDLCVRFLLASILADVEAVFGKLSCHQDKILYRDERLVTIHKYG